MTHVQHRVRGSTLDVTIKLLCAVVRGIIQRKDLFVLKLYIQVRHGNQVSRLMVLEDIARNRCTVTRTERKFVTVLELKPHCEYIP